MASEGNTSAGASSGTSLKKDPGWQYNHLKDPRDTNSVTCNFCGKTTKGGIFRAKQHQIGVGRNALSCKKCPIEVKLELEKYVKEKKAQKDGMSGKLFDFEDVEELGDDDEDVVEKDRIVGQKSGRGANLEPLSGKSASSTNKKGPMDLFMIPKKGKGPQLRQTNINDACDKEARARTIQYIARFFYQAGIPFNVARLDTFKGMIEAIGRYGPNLQPPSYHELRVPLLKKELDYTKELLSGHKEQWTKHGCSIMSDGWTDRKQRSIINFLVNCSLATTFVESIDASSFTKTGEKIFDLLDSFVDKIGEQNVVQVITDNGSNYVLAGKLLQAKRKNLYWTPCAAHCVDLMLEDIGKLPQVKQTLERAIFVIGFIYNHLGALSMMRGFTKNKELVRHGVTRFATTYLTLERVHMQRHNLRNMFTSEKWVQSKWAKEGKGKRAYEIITMPSFWNNVTYILKVMGPLVRVLRLADNEKKPAMGYIYEAMDRAKECIQKAFNDNQDKYKEVFKIIDRRWENQLHHPLHAAGHFLNPEFFYNNLSIESDMEVNNGLLKCIEKLVPETFMQDQILTEIDMYKRAEGMFGNAMAIRARTTKSPATWWGLFGSSTPHLQQLAIKILSLTCSAAGCERNWSVFEHIHTKKRNRLEHQRLHDLVYIKYNQALKARHDMRNVIDPISLNDIDDCNEWLIGEMEALDAEDELVFPNDDLRWGHVARASGVEEAPINTRRATRMQMASSTSAGTSTNRVEVEEEEEDYLGHDDMENYEEGGEEWNEDYLDDL